MAKYIIIAGMITACTIASQALAEGYRTPGPAPIKAERTKAQIERKENKAEAQATRKEVRAEMKVKREATREEFKAKLKTVRDAHKKAAIERIDKNLAELNTRATERLKTNLDQIASVLERITSRTDATKAAGKGVADVQALVATAQSAITSARAAVAAQAAKTYVMTITDEKGLRAEAGRIREALKTDLKKTRDAVKAARDAAHAAAEALGKL